MEEFVETLAASRDPSTFYQLANDEGMSTQIFDVNPYENHPELTQTEAEVLWEYAKLNQRLKIMIAETKRLSQVPEEHLLKDMRKVETKMGFVLTLFQASVWGVINERAAAADTGEDEDLDITADKTVMQ